MPETPTIDQLRALVLLADTGSVSAAADRLGDRQPTVSRRLRDFHNRWPLLETHGSSVTFTPKGTAVLPAIRELVRQYDHLKACLADKTEAPALITVAVGTSASQFFLPGAIARMKERHPDLEIQTRVARGEDRIRGVSEGIFDLAVLSHNELQIEPQKHGLELTELPKQDLCVIVKKDSPEGKQLQNVLAGQRVPLGKLAGWTLIGLDEHSGVRRQIEYAFTAAGKRPRFSVQAGGWLGVKEYANHGLGVGIVPLSILSLEDHDHLVIRRLDTTLQLAYSIIHRRSTSNRFVNDFIKQLKAAGKDHEETIRRRWNSVL